MIDPKPCANPQCEYQSDEWSRNYFGNDGCVHCNWIYQFSGNQKKRDQVREYVGVKPKFVTQQV